MTDPTNHVHETSKIAAVQAAPRAVLHRSGASPLLAVPQVAAPNGDGALAAAAPEAPPRWRSQAIGYFYEAG